MHTIYNHESAVRMSTTASVLDIEDMPTEQRTALLALLPARLRRAADRFSISPATQQEIHAHLIKLVGVLRGGVPGWVWKDLQHGLPAQVHRYVVTLLFIDLTDFTPINEQLQQLGTRGNTELTNILNQFFESMIAIATRWNGDVLAFGGDAILVAIHGLHHAEYAVLAADQMRNAMELLSAIHVEGIATAFALNMKIGIASGPLLLMSIDRPKQRITLALGSVLRTTDQMADQLSGGEIRIDSTTAAMVQPMAALDPSADGTAMLRHILKPYPQPILPHEPNITSKPISVLAALADTLTLYQPQYLVDLLVANPDIQPGMGEQRRVVSLFTTLGGLHPIADTLGSVNPPRVAQIVSQILDPMMIAIEQAGGMLARIDSYAGGHKLLSLFGAPLAREDESHWAAYTALSIPAAVIEAVRKNKEFSTDTQAVDSIDTLASAHPLLKTFSGVHVGQVLAGIVGAKTRFEYTVMGSSVNLAARLMGEAHKQDRVMWISSAVREQLRSVIASDQHTFTPKGYQQPITVFSFTHLPPPPARRISQAQLVGRQELVGVLHALTTAMRDGAARILLLYGEAGIGKSRLCNELQRLVTPQALSIVVKLPFTSPPDYTIFKTLISELHTQTTSGQGVAEWIAMLAKTPNTTLTIAAMAYLLQQPGTDLRQLGTNADTQQQTLTQTILALLALFTRDRPLLLCLEDLHKADHRSIQLLNQIVVAMGNRFNRPLLICATIRGHPNQFLDEHPLEQFRQSASDIFRAGCEEWTLSQLDDTSAYALLEAILPGLAPQTSAYLIERAGGNPLFLELLADTIEQTGGLQEGAGGRVLSTPTQAIYLSTTLSELVLTQIDSLGPEARYMIQVAAVVAATEAKFGRWLVEQTLGRKYTIHWKQMVDYRLFRPDPPDQHSTYVFRHALFQQHAYETLTPQEREHLHQRIGVILDEGDPQQIEQSVNALAFHCYEGRDWERALKYCLIAGQNAWRAYNNQSAQELFERTLEMARLLNRPASQATALEGLAALAMRASDWEQARSLLMLSLQQDNDSDEQELHVNAYARRHRMLAHICEMTGQYEQAQRYCDQGLSYALTIPLPNLEAARIYEQFAAVLWRLGDLEGSRTMFNCGIDALPNNDTTQFDRIQLWLRWARIEIDHGTYAMAMPLLDQSLNIALILGDKGLLGQTYYAYAIVSYHLNNINLARTHAEQALIQRRAIGDRAGVIEALNMLALIAWAHGDHQVALESFETAALQCAALGMHSHQAIALLNKGQLQIEMGTNIQALSDLHAALRIFEQLGNTIKIAQCYYLLSDINRMQGHTIQALSYGITALDRSGDSKSVRACALRTIGEALAMQGDLLGANQRLTQAWELAQQAPDDYDQAYILIAWAELAEQQQQIETARQRAYLAEQYAQELKIPVLTMRCAAILQRVNG